MDIFCQAAKKLRESIIQETENFYLLHDGYPLTEGHMLIIPKTHTDCFLNIKKENKKELDKLIRVTFGFLKNNYTDPKIFEHGGVAQTILHAHLHIVPIAKSIRQHIKRDCVKIKKAKAPYIYYFENNEEYYRPIKKINPGYLHSLFAQTIGRPKEGIKRAKEAKEWTLEVRKKWQKWSRKLNIH